MIDFTTPGGRGSEHARLPCDRREDGGGHDGLVRQAAGHARAGERKQAGLLYGTNFSVGVQVMLRLVHELAIGTHGYELSISEIHHASKKDAPSGTALSLQQTVREAGPELDAAITSQREGDVAGIHELQARSRERPASPSAHEAFSRRGFAEGAVRAAEWISTRTGCYDFTDIYAQLQ